MSQIHQISQAALLGFGSLVLVLAGTGILKLPDLFTRLAAISKASTLGVLLFSITAFLASPDWLTRAKLLLGLTIFFISSPTASHLIGRSGYRRGAKLFKGTTVDEWGGKS